MTLIENERNYGIDIIRCLSMFMVVVLHTIGHGGVLKECIEFSANYYVAWFLETAAQCAVDLFGMISGYVMIKTKYNFFKIIPLWLNVVFYSLIITLIFYFIKDYNISYRKVIKSCMPILTVQYWYFTAYFGVYIFIPYLNKLLNSLTKKEYSLLCITIIILFCLIPLIYLKQFDTFGMGNGYNMYWLICMYIIGGYIKLYPIQISKLKCLLIYVSSILLAWGIKYLSNTYNLKLDLFIDYTSVFIVISGFSLLVLFSQIKIKNTKLRKILLWASNSSFCVYLIHEHPYIRSYIIKNRFNSVATSSAMLIPLKVIFYAFCIFFICVLIDSYRKFLFKLLKIKELPEWIISKNIINSFNWFKKND